MAVQTRSALQTTIDTNVATNTTGAITATDVREALSNLNDSTVNKSTDTNLMGVRVYDVTRQYYEYELTYYNGAWYQANATTVIGAFDASYWDALEGNLYKASLTIETANVLTLNATPIDIVAAVAGKAAVISHGVLTVTYNSVAYATNVTVEIITDTASISQIEFLTALNATTTRKSLGRLKTADIAAGETQLIANKALKVQVQGGNPTAGNSQIKLDIYYTLL